ncbi:DUF3265 domain-containing protein [Vibrio diabolicus]|nr:DUF3265 domain-containing protein [Vibrio diabolicus]
MAITSCLRGIPNAWRSQFNLAVVYTVARVELCGNALLTP